MCCFIGRQDNTFIYCYEVLLQKTTRQHFYLLVMIYCFKRRHSYLAVWYVPSEDDKTTLLFTGMMYCFIRRQDDTFIWQYDVPFIRRQDDTFIYWYDMLLHRTTRRHFYLLPHIIPVNNPPKAPALSDDTDKECGAISPSIQFEEASYVTVARLFGVVM